MKKFLLAAAVVVASASSAFAAAENLYGIGDLPGFGNWSPENGLQLTKVSDGVFSWEGTVNGTGYFAFTEQLGDWATVNAHRYAPAAKDTPAVEGDNSMVYANDASWKISAGVYTFTIDTNNMVLKVETKGEVEKVISYAIHGQLEGDDWISYDLKAENNDLWSATYEVAKKGGNFGIKQNTNGDQSDWYAAGVTFDAENPTFVLNGEGGNCTLNFDEGSYCTFSFVPSTKTLTVTKAENAVSSIANDLAPVEYFNIHGVRVENPSDGLYIIRQGNKVTKTIIR